MKFKLFFVVLIIGLFFTVLAENITTVSGKVYKNTKVMRVYSYGIEITYEHKDGTPGMKLLKTVVLSREIQKRYNLKPRQKKRMSKVSTEKKTEIATKKDRAAVFANKLKQSAERAYWLASLAVKVVPDYNLHDIRRKMLNAQISSDAGNYKYAATEWRSAFQKSIKIKNLAYSAVKQKGQKVSAGDKADARNYVALGNIKYRSRLYRQAIKYYDRAINDNVLCAAAYSNRGLALHKQGKLDEAILSLVKAVVYSRRNSYYYLNLGKVYAVAHKYEYALLAFNEALRNNPTLTAALYNRLWVLDEQRKLKEASKLAVVLKKKRNAPPMSSLLIGIVNARNKFPDDLAVATFNISKFPQQWQWLGAFNRSIATNGTAGYGVEMQKNFGAACQAISTEQFTLAKENLNSISEDNPEAPLPYWLTAMVLAMEDESYAANRLMKKADSLLPKFNISQGQYVIEIYVDRQLVNISNKQIPLLPGAHLVEIRARKGLSKRWLLSQD
jgi:tetratricopeptide (TPR) repeat protein